MRVPFWLKRGWRVGALGTTATLIGLGVWSASRPIPAAQSAPRGLRAVIPGDAFPAPSGDAEADACRDLDVLLPENLEERQPPVVLLMAGTTLRLRVDRNDGTLQVNGTWKAEYGQVDAFGNYRAPAYMPPGGVDTLTYTDPRDVAAELQVRVTPNPSIPGSDATPYVRATVPLDTPVPDGSPSITPPPPAIVGNAPVLVLEPGEAVPAPAAYGLVAPLPVGTVLGVPAYRQLPARIGDQETDAIYAMRDANGLSRARLLVGPLVLSGAGPRGGIDPDPSVDLTTGDPSSGTAPGAERKPGQVRPRCANGEMRAVWDPPQPRPQQIIEPPLTLGTITVDAGMSADILRVFQLNISANAVFQVQGFPTLWKYVRRKHVYVCRNGDFYYMYTRTCVSYARSMTTSPTWAYKYLGWKPGNRPNTPGPESCG